MIITILPFYIYTIQNQYSTRRHTTKNIHCTEPYWSINYAKIMIFIKCSVHLFEQWTIEIALTLFPFHQQSKSKKRALGLSQFVNILVDWK